MALAQHRVKETEYRKVNLCCTLNNFCTQRIDMASDAQEQRDYFEKRQNNAKLSSFKKELWSRV